MMKEWADLRCLSVIVGQHTAKMLPADHPAYVSTDVWLGRNQVIAKALVVTLRVVMEHVLGNCLTQRHLPDEDHPIQAFVLNGAHKALCISVQIR